MLLSFICRIRNYISTASNRLLHLLTQSRCCRVGQFATVLAGTHEQRNRKRGLNTDKDGSNADTRLVISRSLHVSGVAEIVPALGAVSKITKARANRLGHHQ